MTQVLQLGALVLERTSPSPIGCTGNELVVDQPIDSLGEKPLRTVLPQTEALGIVASLRLHWPEYLMEVKVDFWDAFFHGAAQFFGAISGVAIATFILRGAPAHESVRYAVTLPGRYGDGVAFVAELAISFTLMATVLSAPNRDNLARYTPYFVGALYAIYITFETPLSGMSMNPARTFGSAFHASYWHALWLYFLAPTLGMLVAGEVFLRMRNGVGPYCAKLHHANNKRCIFHHGYRATEPRISN